MSMKHDIDNDEIMFQFDHTSISSSSLHLQPATLHPETHSQTMHSHDATSTSEELDTAIIASAQVKGKERSIPVPIRTSNVLHDLFDSNLSPASQASTSFGTFDSSSSSITAFSPQSIQFSSSNFDRYLPQSLSQGSDISPTFEPQFSSSPSSDKGKQRESSVPSLPPLSFSAIDFDCIQTGSSSEHGLYSPQTPSSVGRSPISPVDSQTRDISITSPSSFPKVIDARSATPAHPSYRRHSLSNLNLLSEGPGSSLAPVALSPTFGPPSNLSLQFSAFNQNDVPLDSTGRQSLASTSEVNTSSLRTYQGETGNYPPGWYTASKTPTPVPSTLKTLPSEPSVVVTSALSSAARGSLKNKTRSKSSPYPISVLDFIPTTSSDVFQPLPLVIRNYFDLVLPREMRLAILRALIEVHEADLRKAIEEGRFNMAKATSSKGRWVGRDKGIRELFKLSRVSRGWRDLVFDGELWNKVDLHSFPGLPPALIVQLTRRAGSFIQRLDLSGHIQLLPDSFTDIANDLCIRGPVLDMDLSGSFTQLTTIKLQGCTALTTRSLHHLLVRCKNLETLSVKGMSAVTNVTCDIIANFCPKVVSLNMSRCPNMDAEGIRALSKAALTRREHLALKELRVSGLKHVTDSMMKLLGRAAPCLEVLDLSYSRQVHNSTIEAFVACDDLGASDVDELGVATVLVSPRELGREPTDHGKFRRRVTRLRHLVLSSCILLSDVACSNLAFSVPDLEFLELAGIGPDLADEGLVRLLATTPKIRRLDLEDATDITNVVLSALTPSVDQGQSGNGNASRSGGEKAKEKAQPGHALEHLTVSYAENLTDVAMLRLIKACKKLRVLEADNTHIGSSVLRQFVKIVRERKVADAKIVTIDCRGISESLIKELSAQTRPRLGWRAYGARKLMYLDARDDCEDELRVGQDECDGMRVVVKSFYSWQTVDAVKAVKEKRRKQAAKRMGSEASSSNVGDDGEFVQSLRAARWWSPGGRRAMRTTTPGRTSPPLLPDLTTSDGCTTM